MLDGRRTTLQHRPMTLLGMASSQLPFMVCGMSLAVWSVLVALLGVLGVRWLESEQAGPVVIDVTALLVVITLVSAVAG